MPYSNGRNVKLVMENININALARITLLWQSCVAMAGYEEARRACRRAALQASQPVSGSIKGSAH